MNRSYGDTLQSLTPEEVEGYSNIGGMRDLRSAQGHPRSRERVRSDYYLGWHEPSGDPARDGGMASTRVPPRGFGHGPTRRRGAEAAPLSCGDEAYGAALPHPNYRRGPKGYVRSDEHVRDDVCERLYRSHRVDVSDVSVQVSSGTVSLQGSVCERRMKHDIEDIVEHCFGVRDIDNRIRVNRGSLESWEHADAAAPAATTPAAEAPTSRAEPPPGLIARRT